MCGINGVFHYRGGVADRGADGAPDGDAPPRPRRPRPVARGPGRARPPAGSRSSTSRRAATSRCRTRTSRCGSTYNGELYDWPELKPTLAARGHRFRGTTDTEVLLHLYEEHGDALLEHLRGMFAFALYDRPRRRLLLARDRLGIKPLYWHDDGRRIVFASELKALLLDPSVPREVDRGGARRLPDVPVRALAAHDLEGRPQAPARALPGRATRNGPRVERYWSLPVEPDAGHLRGVVPRAAARAARRGGARAAHVRRAARRVPLRRHRLERGRGAHGRAVPEPVKTFSIGFEEQDVSRARARAPRRASTSAPTTTSASCARARSSCCRGWCGRWTSRSPTPR